MSRVVVPEYGWRTHGPAVAVLAVGGGLLFLLVRTSLRGPAEPPVEAAI